LTETRALALCIGTSASFIQLRPAFFEFLALLTCCNHFFTIATIVHAVHSAPLFPFFSLYTWGGRISHSATSPMKKFPAFYVLNLIKPPFFFVRAQLCKSRILYFNERYCPTYSRGAIRTKYFRPNYFAREKNIKNELSNVIPRRTPTSTDFLLTINKVRK